MRKLIAVGSVAFACAAMAATALAAPAGGGKHFPHFSLMDEHVAVKDLPPEVHLFVAGPPGTKHFGFSELDHGPVWFGQVDRPHTTIAAVGKGNWICGTDQPRGRDGGGGSVCTTLAAARQLGLLRVSSCGKGPARHFRISAVVPDGITALKVEKEGGKIGRMVPVIENTVAFTIGREDVALHGVGDAAAEGLERHLPLGHVGDLGGGRGGCAFYAFVEAPSAK